MPNDNVADDRVLQKLINLTHALSAELSLPSLYDQIIAMAQDVTNADGGTLYILQGSDLEQQLSFEVIRNLSLQIHAGGTASKRPNIPPINLWLDDGSPNNNNVCAYVWHQGRLINIADVYEVTEFDFSGARAFDQQMAYRTKSLLTLPLQNHLGEIIGVLQLINAKDPQTDELISFNDRYLPLVNALASTAAVTLNKQQLIDGSGYPRGLTGDQMSIPARMMAICDIFEALTAKDRPYKKPMPLSQALSILRSMRDDNKIDPDLYDLFVRARVWESYAGVQLLAEQMDITNIAEYL